LSMQGAFVVGPSLSVNGNECPHDMPAWTQARTRMRACMHLALSACASCDERARAE